MALLVGCVWLNVRLKRQLEGGKLPGDVGDGRDETIAQSRDGLNVARGAGIVAQNGADLADAVIHPPLEIHKGVVAPELFLNLLASDDLSVVGRQERQELEWLGCEADMRVELREFVLRLIQVKDTKLEDTGS